MLDPMLFMWFLIFVVCLVAVWYVTTYNNLVAHRNRIDNGWAQIDVQLKRRYDLIPNIIETVKGYAEHEKQVFQNVMDARERALKAGTVTDQAQAENIVAQGLRSIFAIAEAYPQLRASENFQQLQAALADTEDKIRFARQFYNDTVMLYETLRQTFPTSFIAERSGFGKRDYFELDATPDQREAPQVKF